MVRSSRPARLASIPTVRTIRLPTHQNDGFPANNLALRYLAGVQCVGLINNDAFVPKRGLLRRLVDALDADSKASGAASPLMVFERQFVDIELDDPARRRWVGVIPALLGVRIKRASRVDGIDVWRNAQISEGGYGNGDVCFPRALRMDDGSGGGSGARPVRNADLPTTVQLRVSSVGAEAGDRHPAGPPRPSWVTVIFENETIRCGSRWGSTARRTTSSTTSGRSCSTTAPAPTGDGRPRGPSEFDEPAEVFARCGGAVLLRPAYLADVGLFDERFFLYYEDTDLSWRGRGRGWRSRTCRAGSGTSMRRAVGRDPLRLLTERNRLFMW